MIDLTVFLATRAKPKNPKMIVSPPLQAALCPIASSVHIVFLSASFLVLDRDVFVFEA